MLNVFPIDGTVPATPEMLPCKVKPPQDLPTQLQVYSPRWNGKGLAINRLSSLTGVPAVNKIRSPDPLKPVPCREITPYIHNAVCGDRHCFVLCPKS